LTVFAYPPFSVPVLPFVGLVPFFYWLGRPRSAKEIVLGGLAFAVPYFLGNIYWMFNLVSFTSAGWLGAFGSLLMHGLTFFLFPITVGVVRRHTTVALPLIVPFAWTISENARSFGDLAFPWVTLGYSLSEWPFLIQHADVVGVWGISWWLALVNALIAMMILERANAVALKRWGVVLAVVLVAPAVYDVARWRQVESDLESAPTLPVAVIQPNVDQATKWDPASIQDTFAKVNRLIAEAEGGSPALVVGPEACLPLGQPSDSTRLPGLIAAGSKPLLIGVVTGIGSGNRQSVEGRTFTTWDLHYNSAFLADADRAVIDRHDKQYLVPVTEQVPYKTFFGFMLPFYRKHFGRFLSGETLELMSMPGSEPPEAFGSLICYESLFPRLVSRMRGMGARFFVNITNDAWFGRSTFPYQHAGFCSMRAIENRAAIVRAANTGISGFVDPLGRLEPGSGIFHEAVLTGEVSLSDGPTVYNRVGDLLLWISYAVVGVTLGLAWRGYRRR
jgi:apolipoprotein N-acyltransferase